MRLDRLTASHVRRAVRTYMECAWPPGEPSRPRFDVAQLDESETLTEILTFFDQPKAGQGPACARYTLRLGNYRYPFMKFVVQEYLIHEEYFFSVDTHDELKITPDMPDYEGWLELRRFNRQLKLAIERDWNAAELPTNEDLRGLMEGLARLEREEEKRARILVVDDEREVAHGLAAILGARGYDVEVAFDGLEVLARLEREPRVDLVMLDYSMPECDGEEVMRRVRADPRFEHLPILLATASSIDLTVMQRATGLLRKPYPREVLLAMIQQMLAAKVGAGSDLGGAPDGGTGQG
ncbi:MAG: response regulator [Planctomycetota bacterium]|nr:MAG: response regulator [Planctomycetota bacterium]